MCSRCPARRGLTAQEATLTRRGGKRFSLLVSAGPLRDKRGRLLGCVITMTDITELKRTEEALIAANQQLNASEQQLVAANQQLRSSEQQLRAANQQLRSSEQQLRAANQQLESNERQLKRVNHDLQERIKEMSCLYSLSELVEKRDISMEHLLEQMVCKMPAGWQYPEHTCACAIFNGHRFKARDYCRKTASKLTSNLKVNGRKRGSLSVCYLRKKPKADKGPFLKEKRQLLDQLAERLGRIAERKQAQEENRIYQAKLKDMASQLSRIQESERRKLAVELHDGVNQRLAMAKFGLESLAQSLADADTARRLKDIAGEIGKTMGDAYALMLELSNPVLYEIGLTAAVEELLRTGMLERHGIKGELTTGKERLKLGMDIRVVLYQVIRELLTNVVRHARAKQVEVRIQSTRDVVKATVRDNGIGFDPSKIRRPSREGGFGLFNIRESLSGLEGELIVKSKLGKSTLATVCVPLHR